MAASLQAAWTSTSASKGESLLRVLLELQRGMAEANEAKLFYRLRVSASAESDPAKP